MDLQGGPNGAGFDDRTFLHHNASLVTATLFGGAIGWFIGAVIGWLLSRPAIEPSRARAWGLRAAAMAVVVVGLASLSVGSAASEGADTLTLQTMIPAGAALVAVTLVVLAQRGRFRRPVAVIGAVVAVVILLGAGMRFGSLLPFDRAWLNGWRSKQADAGSFAPNLLGPAPRECPDGFAGSGWPYAEGPPGRLLSWAPYNPYWLDGHVPRWLPDGFGLLPDRSWSTEKGAVAWGVWADEGCRQIRLTLAGGNPNSPRWSGFPAVDHVGGWAVTAAAPGSCPGVPAAEGHCLEYRAWPDERGEEGGWAPFLLLQMLGVDRDEGDRIAMGIPV